jgi:signal peptidase I
MASDEWWTQAVDQFGLDAYLEPIPAAPPVDEAFVPASQPAPERRHRHLGFEVLAIAVVALGIATLLRIFVVQQFAVQGRSMLGTLHSGDRVLVNKLSYRLHDPRRGDIVVLKDVQPSVEDRDLIKRVVGLPGETVEYRRCELFIDGRRFSEPYLDPLVVGVDRCGPDQVPVVVEVDHVFVMGDNRGASLDSRADVIGQVSFSNLIGRAFIVVWPTSDWRWL